MQRARMRTVTWIVVTAMLVTMLAVASPAFAQWEGEVVVYRFYNQGTGTHFYTASAAERDHVIATWPAEFTYEGPAFFIFPPGFWDEETEASRASVHRFYNRNTRSHFYTISAAEADMVKVKYPAVFNYDGVGFEAYTISNGNTPLMPVYRFYNKLNGAHFYTISATEKAIVQIQYRDTYRFEGVAFYASPYEMFR